jgi:membrane protein
MAAQTGSIAGPSPRLTQRPRLNARALVSLIRETLSEWSEDKAPRLGAALAYYTVFSIAPLLVIAVAVAGLLFDPAEAERALLGQLGGLVGASGADLIGEMLAATRKPGAGILASILGIVGLLLGAMGAFGQLQDALNTIWEVKPKEGRGLRGLIHDRLLSLSMVVTVGFLLMVSLVVSTVLAAVGTFVGGWLPESVLLLNIVNFLLSLIVITVLFALLFKYVPDVKMAWNDVWLGAAVTAVLFTIGKTAIGLYLGNAAVTSSYGAAGSLVVLLLWVYYSTQILFLGAEFTQVYANQFGSRVAPADNAVAVGEAARKEEGLERDPKSTGPAPATAPLDPDLDTLPVVGPFVALKRDGEPQPVVGRALPAREPSGSVWAALVTFLGGLGFGLIMSLQYKPGRSRRRH